MSEQFIPVLIGCGQVTEKKIPEEASTPVQLMAQAAQLAATDAGPGDALLNAIDAIVAVGLVVDGGDKPGPARGMYKNVPKTVSNILGISPTRQIYTAAGGNTPQMLVNKFSEAIANGEYQAVLLTGSEALHSMGPCLKAGMIEKWSDDPGGEPETLGNYKKGASDHEASYDMHVPANVYPLFENALRGKYGRSVDEHQQKMGELFHRFTEVAAKNSLAWFATERSAEEIATVSESNRYIGFPYTKYLNSIIRVNQGAAVILTSLAKAKELGVSEDKLVYLHGCADANEIWNVSDRVNYHSSPAMNVMAQKAFAMADKNIDDMAFLDIYSCFPSAVQIACDEFGIAHDDARGLTLTGGLPYFGGPGNNYVMHSIAEMMTVLRANPGQFGMLNANGWFITKHAMGIYSTTPLKGKWQREAPESYQQAILDLPHPDLVEKPEGEATIETYTVIHSRAGVERGLVVGRLLDGRRFIAETPDDEAVLLDLMQGEALGRTGMVSQQAGKNLFVPN